MSMIVERIKSFILYLEKFTKLDHRYLFGAAFWIYVANVISIALGVLTTIIFARFSDKITFGYYQYIFAVLGVVGISTLPGLNNAMLQSLVKGQDRTIFFVVAKKIKYGLIGSFALVLYSLVLFCYKQNPVLAIAVFSVGLLFAFESGLSIMPSYFSAKKNFMAYAKYITVARLVDVTALVIGVLFLKHIYWIIILYFIASISYNFYLYRLIKKLVPSSAIVDASVLRHGKTITVSNILPQILNNFDKLIIPLFLGSASLAIYAVAIKIPDTIKGFLNSLDAILLPKMVDKDPKNLILKMFNLWVLGGLLIATAVLFLLLPLAIKLIFGPSYIEATKAAQIYSFSIIPVFYRRLVNNWMMANGKNKKYFINHNLWIILSSVLILLALWLKGGIVLVVWARIIAISVAMVNGIFLIYKSSKA